MVVPDLTRSLLGLGMAASRTTYDKREETANSMSSTDLRRLRNHYASHGKRMQVSLKSYFRRHQRSKEVNETTRPEEEEEDTSVSALATRAEPENLVHFDHYEMDLIVPTHHMKYFGGDALRELQAERDIELARATFVNFDGPGDMLATSKDLMHHADKLRESYIYEYVVAAKVTTNDMHWLKSHADYAVDTGATHHVTNLLKALTDPRSTRMTITGVSGPAQRLDAEGTIVGEAYDDHGQRVQLTMNDAVLHKRAHMNLLSASQMLKTGTVMHLETGNCYIIIRGTAEDGTLTESTIPLVERDGLFYLQLEHLVPAEEIRAQLAVDSLNLDGQHGQPDVKVNLANYADLTLWHKRLGHMDKRTIRLMFNNKVFEGLDVKDLGRGCDSKCSCPTCQSIRATKQPVQKTARYDAKLYGIPFRNVQTDLKGPLVKGFGGYRYSMSFICSETRYGKTYYLARKGDAHLALRQFLKDIKAMGYAAPINILSDMGSEFVNTSANKQAGEKPKTSKFDKMCERHGIDHQVTPPHTSRINGRVERYHRTLHEAANAFLHDARLSPIFWCYALQHAEYVKNRVVHRALGTNITPHEIVTRMRPRRPRLRHVRVRPWRHVQG
mmetsp:Transcript_97940/g.280157  ORF Transcript_97940/g.280157 Transcript_97940/m.280157 type:complete len:613 (+) Transcript_97940:1833-3671(+)